MVSTILGILIGCFIICHLPLLPSFGQFLTFAVIGISLIAILWHHSRSFSLLLLGMIIGCCWTSFNGYLYLQHQFPTTLENKILTIEGTVLSLPAEKSESDSFLFKIKKIKEYPQYKVKGHVRLSWYKEHNSTAQLPTIKPGDHWQFHVRIKRLHGFANPGGFDFAAWGVEHNISATGYILPKLPYKLLSSHWTKNPIGQFRLLLKQKIAASLGQTPETSLITALTLGDQSGISETQWTVFRNTGTNHLMAIAGLHIGFWTGFIFIIVNFLWRYSSKLCLRLPSIEAAGISALIAAIIYSALAGFSLPTQRALIMISVFILSLLLRRNLAPFRALILALGIVLLINPFSVLAASFWLSFGAVFSIIYGLSYRLHAHNLWWKWGRLQWVITLFLIPFSLLFFQQASLCGFIANIIAVPWVGLAVLPLCLIGSAFLFIIPPLGVLFLKLAALLLKLLWPILTYLASLHYSIWQQAIPNNWLLVMALLGFLILIAPRGLPRWLGVFWLAPLIFFKAPRPEQGQLWLTVLDVGQGLATVLQTQHHTLIYDTGPKFGDEFNAGNAIIIPFLHNKSITHIDTLIVSHGDNDHIGGAHAILQRYQIPQIFTSEPDLLKPYLAMHCQLGQHWTWDGVNFEIIYPLEKLPFEAKRNNISCVLRVTVGDKHLILPGDIEKKAEKYLVSNEKILLGANILLAPHHGSNTSSTIPFVQAVKPNFVIFATGYFNRFGFPKPIIISRYHSYAAETFNTANTGAILFKVTPFNPIQISNYRSLHKHFWDIR